LPGFPDQYHSLAGQVKEMTRSPQPKDKSIDFEFASLLAFCKLGEAVHSPQAVWIIVDSLHTLAKDHGMPNEVYANSIAFADTVSAVIMQWSKADNYLQTRTYPNTR
jgi:hypothetical protein